MTRKMMMRSTSQAERMPQARTFHLLKKDQKSKKGSSQRTKKRKKLKEYEGKNP